MMLGVASRRSNENPNHGCQNDRGHDRCEDDHADRDDEPRLGVLCCSEDNLVRASEQKAQITVGPEAAAVRILAPSQSRPDAARDQP